MKFKHIPEAVTFLYLLLFAYAALSKYLDLEKFSIQVDQSPMLTGLGNFIPWCVIGSEISVCLLLVSRFRLIGFFAAFTLMTMFTAYIIAILRFSSYTPCSCGGILEKLGWTEHLVFNITFMILAVVAIILEPGKLRLSAPSQSCEI